MLVKKIMISIYIFIIFLIIFYFQFKIFFYSYLPPIWKFHLISYVSRYLLLINNSTDYSIDNSID